jgi:hypothetical protein
MLPNPWSGACLTSAGLVRPRRSAPTCAVVVAPIVFTLLGLAAPAAFAAWPSSGLPVATGPGHRALPVGITAPDGDLQAFWIEVGTSPYALFAQRLTIQGTIASGWPVGGRGVVTTPAAVSRAEVVPDGAGGALIAWYDYRSTGGPRGIYGVRVDAQANVVSSWNPNGTPIFTTFTAEGWGPMNDQARLCSDGNGGAFVAWTDSRNTPPMGILVYDVFAQHVLANGTLDPAWPAQGLALTVGSGYKYSHDLIADDAGGFWLVSENPLDTSQLRVTHHTGSGSVSATWITPSYASQPDAVSDGAGGIFVTWQDCRNCPAGPDGIYAMRFGPSAGGLGRSGACRSSPRRGTIETP